MAIFTTSAFGQHLNSPQVNADNSVTLRVRAPNATQVEAMIAGQRLALTKETGKTWSATSTPLEPGIYDYIFNVDGTRVIDPHNRWVKKWLTLASLVEVPGKPPLLSEFQQVPHGVVRREIYPSQSVGHARPVTIYTPPGYDSATGNLPLVLLLHGFGDDETAWTEVGRAHFIADNLLAQGRIQPSIIAMPHGHPLPIPDGKRPVGYGSRNAEVYNDDLVSDLLPFLEANYRVSTDSQHRSIVGLSMGGGHAINTGLKNLDKFTSIGAFSAATPESDLAERFPMLTDTNPAANDHLRHFWIAIGKRDFLLKRNHTFRDFLESNHIKHSYRETAGGHEWKLWREYLVKFLEL